MLLLATALIAGGAPAAAELLAHRAVYDVTLAAARAQSVTGVDGRMEFVWKDVCDGWTIEYRARLSVAFAERGVRDMSWRYSAWESDDGRHFRYFLRRFSSGKETELLRGNALPPGVAGINLPITGAIDALRELGHEVLPLCWCSAPPSAHVTDEAFETVAGMLLEDLRGAGALDGLYLDLHGAMVTESIDFVVDVTEAINDVV